MKKLSNNMLVEFRFANFMSFKDVSEFTMLATSDETNESGSVVKIKDDRILRSAGIYGANGSGKSNFIAAFNFIRLAVGFYGRNANDLLEDNCFRLDRASNERPSYFEVVFYCNDQKYRYGFEVDTKEVNSEWLFVTTSTKETKLFTRDKQKIELGRAFKEGRGLDSNTKSNRLFLTVVAELNGSISQSIVDWFAYLNLSSGVYTNVGYTMHVLTDHDEKDKEKILGVLKKFDLHIKDIKVVDLADTIASLPQSMAEKISDKSSEDHQMEIVIVRDVYENGKKIDTEEFFLDEESDGTQRLVALAGYIVESLDHGIPVIVDEIEAKLHPLITRAIIELFNSSELSDSNPQIIFTTHDTNLLNGNLLRRDQIWFTEKDRYGASHMYSLSEYKQKPRKDASLEKNYIRGRYGGVPFIGDINELLASK